MFLLLPHGDDAGEWLASPFESWCAVAGIDPEDSRAWMLFQAEQQAESVSQTPAAS